MYIVNICKLGILHVSVHVHVFFTIFVLSVHIMTLYIDIRNQGHQWVGFGSWFMSGELCSLPALAGVGGAVRFLVVGTIGQELWMEQCLTLLKYWPIWYTIWADPNYTWGLAILADSLRFSVNNILAGLWLNCISSVEITLSSGWLLIAA